MLALKAENISKQYRLGEVGTGTLSHDLNRFWHKVRGKEDPYLKIGDANDRTTQGNSDYVWSLRDINFEVSQGDAVGIIGRNGAGKSTLLKLLSKVTKPTTGKIYTNGRIASLLEVGTGFHPEMTGRENVFLNGAILGMTRKEIKRKFDEIVNFSGVERYIDTPVKRYSSGMYVRLAFAVAAHLESEILIVDEVLAVGDADFQKKCLNKMSAVTKGEGRTILFVSHNMAAIKTLCTKGILLDNGKVDYQGNIDETVLRYLGSNNSHNTNHFIYENIKNEFFCLQEIIFKNKSKSVNEPLDENEEIEFITNFILNTDLPERYHITYHLKNDYGEALFSFSSNDIKYKKGENSLTCIFPKKFFQSGNYYLSFFFVEDKKQAIIVENDIVSFSVVDGNREIGVYMGREPGFIRPEFNWKIQ
ncbi:ATP-binding cassette domain-containing protein [Chryseobacterium indologenes]|uniref:ABC transporter ATP-binding protein n=1 Tax=Chryseobacterium indologenes TaxID=253 RepID=UPI0003E0602F|nr:polysaccharide ABC transporter ATP-binding protein [Chryseobacterium indologenes]QPQ53483.1 ATP-binding cassette domain-containing protein [Chryseobacterium indologenes]GAE63813.1 putative ABC transporter ATP-binding protein [Chryseobacterium indologenes NBRC 14944]SFJ56451.1 lipopolysaccharide transport system ATP-binding protein [Chryseobacterium indologenes]SUX52345.1 Teichoic acids export ATP-binding protein TagH [Chryseobacterium indologenes]